MQSAINIKELMADGRSQEQAGHWDKAAERYQRIVDASPDNRDAVKRLLMLYRRLKDSGKELSTIKAALDAMEQKDQSAQGKWLAANPQAAKIGKAMLRSLGGAKVSAYGTDAFVEQLLKRKDLVERKISGVKTGRKKTKGKGSAKDNKIKASPPPKATDTAGSPLRVIHAKKVANQLNKKPVAVKSQPAKLAKIKLEREKQREEAARKKKERIAERATALEKKRTDAAAKRAKAQEMREAAAKARKEASEDRKREKAAAFRAKQQEAAAAKAEEIPSFFVISLRYLVPLIKIDNAMSRHVSFLNKYFASRVFLMAGRQVPRTGGIIIAQAKDRDYLERIMRQDPFVKQKLASFDIIEFRPSKTIKELQSLLRH